jgi:unsaturated chondroitin disaccharide hydrolase
MSVALLTWAAQETGDKTLREVGISHALRHIDICIRPDGSVCQSASFDPETGQVVRRYTHKGITDQSTWTRAQAWAMLGYSLAARWVPERPEFLAAARRVSDWWLDHVPPDLAAYWDFDAPQGPPTKRDTSGTAVAAASLLKLSRLLPPEEGHRYREAAERTVRALIEVYLTPVGPEDGRPPGILTKGCYNHRIGLATENELIWGSYYLYESLHVLTGQLEPTKI